jgi:hypothetical protein
MAGSNKGEIAHVATEGGRVPVSAHGIPVPFSNEYFEGSVFFAHRQSGDAGKDFVHDELLEISGAPWELQIQGRFKTKPHGQVFCGGELREGPMQLGMVISGFCRLILKLAKAKAQQRGAEIRYGFGNEDSSSKPHMCGPLLKAHRLFRSDHPIPLPIVHNETHGTWEWQEQGWTPIERVLPFFDDKHYFAFSLSTQYLDFDAWNIVGIPGVGSVDLRSFWGNQPCCATVFDDGVNGSGPRCFIDIELLPPPLRASRATAATLKKQEAVSETSSIVSTDASSNASPELPSHSEGEDSLSLGSCFEGRWDEDPDIPSEFADAVRKVAAPRAGHGRLRRAE